MSAEVPRPEEPVLECPGCSRGRVRGSGRVVCSGERCAVEVVRFPLVVDVVAESGVGRCARHPAKDGVAACGRCGAFVCDVCLTRTGEKVLCPACFDLLHSRAELETTKSTRFRVDYLACALSLASCLCYGVGLPFALGLGIWGLRRSRKEPWISRKYCWAAIAISGLQLVLLVFAIVAALVTED